LAAAPVARILERHPDVVLAAVYAVPDQHVGDQVMAALQLRPGVTFDPDRFARFLAEQPDLGPKWAPRYVRVCPELPVTATAKVLARALRAERWNCADPVWWRAGRGPGGAYHLLLEPDATALEERVAAR
jgi:fatty-acyl-CoA synthase